MHEFFAFAALTWLVLVDIVHNNPLRLSAGFVCVLFLLGVEHEREQAGKHHSTDQERRLSRSKAYGMRQVTFRTI